MKPGPSTNRRLALLLLSLVTPLVSVSEAAAQSSAQVLIPRAPPWTRPNPGSHARLTGVEARIVINHQGIIVNTIHCGSESDRRNGKWCDAPLLAEGKFMTIDQNQQVAHIAAPQDAEIAKLGEELKQCVAEKSKESAVILTKIYELNTARNRYVADQQKANGTANTLDTAIASAVREQAAKRSFVLGTTK